MKTLESILNRPERRLSAEELKMIKGGSDNTQCTCDWYDVDGTLVQSQTVVVTGGDCVDGTNAIMQYYGDMMDVMCY